MDKVKVITAYRCGMITIQECAQILGVEGRHLTGILNDPKLTYEPAARLVRHTVTG
ncbi:hypothetical protein [Paenibacillus daejeonensis]|uniref:hypothetical protein n=1 Tax=Paenibacillus daejeonensis TaxID=135193 RepID=UPI0003809816|nr:hypothetical protein [Paenibacillus daejeonensis]